MAEVLVDLSGPHAAETTPPQEPVKPEVRAVGAIMMPHGRERLTADVLPDVHRDIVEVVADAAGPMQAKQIVPRIGLPAVTTAISTPTGRCTLPASITASTSPHMSSQPEQAMSELIRPQTDAGCLNMNFHPVDIDTVRKRGGKIEQDL
ncbi:hypothetical protein AB5J56_00815 [Streptomyces sp. R21]|uniref:Uncharacterized protein n=1 Tax=Streptomyces sp. R21 TaxID=3238627 RepID=A0AB39NYF2_9ACTN